MYITFLYFSNNKYKTNFDISHDSLLVIDFLFFVPPAPLDSQKWYCSRWTALRLSRCIDVFQQILKLCELFRASRCINDSLKMPRSLLVHIRDRNNHKWNNGTISSRKRRCRVCSVKLYIERYTRAYRFPTRRSISFLCSSLSLAILFSVGRY